MNPRKSPSAPATCPEPKRPAAPGKAKRGRAAAGARQAHGAEPDLFPPTPRMLAAIEDVRQMVRELEFWADLHARAGQLLADLEEMYPPEVNR